MVLQCAKKTNYISIQNKKSSNNLKNKIETNKININSTSLQSVNHEKCHHYTCVHPCLPGYVTYYIKGDYIWLLYEQPLKDLDHMLCKPYYHIYQYKVYNSSTHNMRQNGS